LHELYFLLSPINENKKDSKRDKKKLKIRAEIHPSTENPSIKESAIKIIIALITKRKRPKDNMVTGKVKMTMIGFTKALSNAKITATIIAVV